MVGVLLTWLLAWPGLALAAAAAADPSRMPTGDSPNTDPIPKAIRSPLGRHRIRGSGVLGACSQFGAAINYAASNYEDFAYNGAGSGNPGELQGPDPLHDSNVGPHRPARGRCAARDERRGTTPGPPEVSPMRSWSLHATKAGADHGSARRR